jgi:2-phospho-L-lactate guanylyltransferase
VADLALAAPAAIDRLVDAAGDADVAIAPGRVGGTNALVVSRPDFRVDFHGVSYRDHRCVARDVGAEVAVVDSMRLSTDVDEPADLTEVLLHGEGEAAEWLRERFELDAGEGRVGLTRIG